MAETVKRIVPGAKTAVLMIHGIVGTPRHFDPLLPAIPEGWTLYNLLLDGHGKAVPDFGRTSMKKWLAQVDEAVDELLQSHERIVLVAHSMGTLFSIRCAIAHPRRIAGLFLLAVPTRPHLPLSTALTALRLAWGEPAPRDTAARAMAAACGTRLTRKLWQYIPWAPRFLELLALCRKTRQELKRLQVNTVAFQSRVDELVSFRSREDLQGHPYIQTHVLEHSGHFVYAPEDAAFLRRELEKLVQELEAGEK